MAAVGVDLIFCQGDTAVWAESEEDESETKSEEPLRGGNPEYCTTRYKIDAYLRGGNPERSSLRILPRRAENYTTTGSKRKHIRGAQWDHDITPPSRCDVSTHHHEVYA